ncbi:hypothetical protein [Aquimarina litoralis]|uniref:hypothetical protein n=1 Tax=Aquimarina litoralis TaxID=584605 RepID=UPI001C5A3EC1|nr:hypothetical protein [Aquimarina litoralis]MBW1296979.1 hypothetical protein [Aquimarina litoralis]
MEHQMYRSTGIAMILGALLIIATMVLHPSGGTIEHIIKISKTIRSAHALAIFSLPILLFGFYGLTIALLDKWKLSILGFIVITFGLIAAMFAALFNGLALPYFLNKYADTLEQNIETLNMIKNYGFAINIPLDYVFIVACCFSILLYSIVIILEKKYPRWISYLGIFITILSIVGGLTDFVFTNLVGFRIFTFSIAGWVLSSGILLVKHTAKK